MKRRLIAMLLAVATMLSLCAFSANAADSDIMLLSDGAEWEATTITTTSKWVTSGYKNDTTSAEVYFTKSSYPASSKIEIRIYDYTAGCVASSWATYTPYVSGNYYKVVVPYNSGRAISGHTYVLNLRWNSQSSVSSATISGVFYP
jgi:ABC-type glycerol-3-phosphate transport system substrate-binding protein